ncbi:MAG: hypothetical protein Q8N16_02720 [bacterium]|nr:hypothetical protein [bacterium]
MNKSELEKIVCYLVEQGLSAIKNNTDEKEAVIDYVAIFSKDENEYKDLELAAESIGEEVDKETIRTGRTFLLKEPIKTPAGILSLIKIRKPDATRPQRGAPDFKIKDYQQFKEKYLRSSGNFTLILKKDYEMIEIKGVDALVYIPDRTLGERMEGIKTF